VAPLLRGGSRHSLAEDLGLVVGSQAIARPADQVLVGGGVVSNRGEEGVPFLVAIGTRSRNSKVVGSFRLPAGTQPLTEDLEFIVGRQAVGRPADQVLVGGGAVGDGGAEGFKFHAAGFDVGDRNIVDSHL